MFPCRTPCVAASACVSECVSVCESDAGREDLKERMKEMCEWNEDHDDAAPDDDDRLRAREPLGDTS